MTSFAAVGEFVDRRPKTAWPARVPWESTDMTTHWRQLWPRNRHGRAVVLVACLGLLAVTACSHTTPTAGTATTGSATSTSTKSASPAVPITVTAPPTTTTSGPAPAPAGPGDFQSPSGGVYCILNVGGDGKGGVVCQGGGNYSAPTPTDCSSAWGDRFSLDQGDAPVSHCHGDTIVPSHSAPGPIPDVPILGYGQTRIVGSITCDSEASGVTCTDSSTEHFIHLSREANGIG
ncbi:MAG: hypothetical protein JWQ86_4785 [Mycobacterium sp.]|jgi:hypothetical protein|nr:hypothetical protein [Mycobacterium sp.]